MLHIKKIVLLVLLSGFMGATFAQTTSDDYNNIQPFSGTSAFRKFTIGVNVGAMTPSALFGGTNDFAKPQVTLGYGANIGYQINHYLGLRADYLGGTLKGEQDSKDYAANRTVTSFKTKLKSALSLSAVGTFGGLNFFNQKNKVLPYLSAGVGVISSTAQIVPAGSTTPVDFSNPVVPKHPMFFPVEAGLNFNLSSLINLELAYRMNFVDGDYLDGYSARPNHHDNFSYTHVGLQFALGNQSKPQLVFDNPVARLNNNLQTQIDTVKEQTKKLANDADGDGVADMFDKEPNTPAGCPVDSHGVSRDTDGDGVPDCKDKELVTPTQCQPVDADGVGKCPEPDCCKAIRDTLAAMNACNLNLPSITFSGRRSSLTSDAKAMLANVASQMKNSPNCNIVVTGYPAATKASQSLANSRVEAIKAYLTETEGISADRIDTNVMVGGGDVNTVDIQTK